MRVITSRQFHKDLRKLEAQEREARLRWIEHTVGKRIEAAEEPIEFEYVSLASLHALLTCDRDLIPVEFWRPAEIYPPHSFNC